MSLNTLLGELVRVKKLETLNGTICVGTPGLPAFVARSALATGGQYQSLFGAGQTGSTAGSAFGKKSPLEPVSRLPWLTRAADHRLVTDTAHKIKVFPFSQRVLEIKFSNYYHGNEFR